MPRNSQKPQFTASHRAVQKARTSAYHIAKTFRKTPCPTCKLHGCVCQSQLSEFGEKI